MPTVRDYKPVAAGPLPYRFEGPIRTDHHMTLILVQGCGRTLYARTREGKDALLAERSEGDLLLLVWMHHWRTDVFLMTPEDVAKHYAPHGTNLT
jgi:hypothetical protein